MRSSSASGQDKNRTATGGGASPYGHGFNSTLPTPEFGDRRPPSTNGGGPLSPSHSGSAFGFSLRSISQNKSNSTLNQQGQGNVNAGMQRSPSGSQLSQSKENGSSDSTREDAGIRTIQQLLEQGSTERRDRKQLSGNSGVATFSGRIGSIRIQHRSSGWWRGAPTTEEKAHPKGDIALASSEGRTGIWL
jgi:hypothetical protein